MPSERIGNAWVAFILLLGLLTLPSSVCAQGSRFDSTAQRTVQGFVAPIPGAQITVCTSAGTGTPCSPVTPIYSDAGLTLQIPGSVIPADSNGNYGFWAPPGTYKYSITATGITGQLYTVTLPIVLGPGNTLTATLISPSANPAATGFTRAASGDSHCWRNAANTADLCLSKTAGDLLQWNADTIATPTAAQTLTNKTLTTASSGNSVTSLNAQANGSAVAGTGSAVVLYTYTLPGSTAANLKGIRVTVGWIHSTGSAVVNYALQLNGTSIATISNSAFSGNGAAVTATILNTGSATAVVTWNLADYSLNQIAGGQSKTVGSGLAWSSSQPLQFTFSVANTDQVTPIFWNVELIQ